MLGWGTRHDKEQEGANLYRKYNKDDRYVTRWFWQPHTILLLLGFLIALIYVAFTRDESLTVESNTKIGLIAVCLAFLVFSALQMRDGLFVRPHPVVWRVIMGAAVLYLLLLVFILFQSAADMRWLLSKLDSSLGKRLPERSYAEDCRLYTPENPNSSFYPLMSTLNDEFMIAHGLGWFGKALLLRDVKLCWILSLLFEIMELTFEHMLPNFAECWWDHIILDILVMNALGIHLGMWALHFFEGKPYSWITGGVDVYHWDVLKSWKRLIAVLSVISAVNLIELNAFFLKYVLWVPPPHYLNIVRLFLWWGIGLPGTREFYQYATDPNCKKFGPMSWLCVATIAVESLVCVKFGRGTFPNPAPAAVVWSWTIFLVSFLVWGIWFYGIRTRNEVVVPKQKDN